MSFREQLGNAFLILDGAMGTMLQQRGLEPGQCPEIMNVTKPEVVSEVQKSYVDAGSMAIYSNTFGANAHKLTHAQLDVASAVQGGIRAAKSAAGQSGVFVGLDLGPIGELVEPMGTLTFEETYELYRQQVEQGVAAGADFIVIESFADLYEVKAALLAAKEHSTLPVIVTMSFEETMRSYTGCHVTNMGATLESLGADAVGINCSLGPVQIHPIAKVLAQSTNLPLVAKPNAGLPVFRDGESVYDITPQGFAHELAEYAELGFTLFGGCCGTTPEYIRLLKEAVCEKQIVTRQRVDLSAILCTPSKSLTVSADSAFTVVKAADKTMDDLMDEAMEAIYEGSDGVCLHLSGEDTVMTVKTLQASVNLPFVFHTQDVAALEQALRCYNGRPGVTAASCQNSDCLAAAQRYGAAIVHL